MRKFLIILTFFLASCQNGKQKNETKMLQDTTLIEKIDLNNSLFHKNDLELKKYKYNGVFIENLSINKLLDKKFRTDFFSYLKKRENEDDFKITLFTKLLMIRIQQLKDVNAFLLLSEESKDVELSFDGIELLNDSLIELFLQDSTFFLKQSVKNNNNDIVNYIMSQSDEFLVKEEFIEENMGFVANNDQQLLLNKDFQEAISDKILTEKLKKFPTVEVIFSPSLYSGWENKTIKFININEMFGTDFTKNLNVAEHNFFKFNILPTLKKYYLRNYSYSIQDPDGFTNLRQEKNSTSEILQKVKSGESIEVLDNTADWFLVKTKEGKEGYIHKSRIKSN